MHSVRWKQGKTGIPNDPEDCSNSVSDGVAMISGWVCTCKVGDTVDVENIHVLILQTKFSLKEYF